MTQRAHGRKPIAVPPKYIARVLEAFDELHLWHEWLEAFRLIAAVNETVNLMVQLQGVVDEVSVSVPVFAGSDRALRTVCLTILRQKLGDHAKTI